MTSSFDDCFFVLLSEVLFLKHAQDTDAATVIFVWLTVMKSSNRSACRFAVETLTDRRTHDCDDAHYHNARIERHHG
jgi:hypothetical protein